MKMGEPTGKADEWLRDSKVLDALSNLVTQMGQNPVKWGHPAVAHRLCRIIFLLHEVTDWMESPVLSLHTDVLKALNKLLGAAIQADGSATTSPPKETPMPEKPKLCINCRWSYLPEGYTNLEAQHHNAYCQSPKAGFSLVTGKPLENCAGLRYASASYIRCGPEGKWFEAKG